mmetsp:Transcript_23343/g.66341  ORF Transcript_23343/g.66341 Transcript_23343/m.66341 type:complete len:421 (+) Transcript_23343:145-1407(+)
MPWCRDQGVLPPLKLALLARPSSCATRFERSPSAWCLARARATSLSLRFLGCSVADGGPGQFGALAAVRGKADRTKNAGMGEAVRAAGRGFYLCGAILGACTVLGYCGLAGTGRPVPALPALAGEHEFSGHIAVPGLTRPWREAPVALVAAALVLVCHELGHALAARANQIPIRGFAAGGKRRPAMAFTVVDGPAMRAAPQRAQAAVILGGVWHNVLLCALAAHVAHEPVACLRPVLHPNESGATLAWVPPRPSFLRSGLRLGAVVGSVNGVDVPDADTLQGWLSHPAAFPPYEGPTQVSGLPLVSSDPISLLRWDRPGQVNLRVDWASARAALAGAELSNLSLAAWLNAVAGPVPALRRAVLGLPNLVAQVAAWTAHLSAVSAAFNLLVPWPGSDAEQLLRLARRSYGSGAPHRRLKST